MKNKKTLVLELGDKLIKACLIDLSNNKIVERLEVFEFSEELTFKSIESVILKVSVRKHQKLAISLPRTFFLMRFLQLPSRVRKEAAEMLPFQLAKVVPYPLEETLYDFSLTDTEESSSEAIVFLVQEKRISETLSFIKKNKITPQTITINSLGLLSWLDNQKKYYDLKSPLPIVVIDIDKYSVNFLAAIKGNMIFSRAFAYTEDSELYVGISNSLRIFEKKIGESQFSKVIFTGIRKEEIIDKLNLGQSVFINHQEKFSIKKEVKGETENSNFSFASILGLAKVQDYAKFDFSPQFLKNKREKEKRKRKYLEIIFIGIEIILISGVFLFKYGLDKYNHLKLLDHKLKEIRIEVEELDEVSDKLQVLNKEIGERVLFSEVLYRVVNSISGKAQLTLLDFQKKGDFSLKGYANDTSAVFEIIDYLNSSKLFKQVRVKYASKVKRGGQVKIEFYIYGKFRLKL